MQAAMSFESAQIIHTSKNDNDYRKPNVSDARNLVTYMQKKMNYHQICIMSSRQHRDWKNRKRPQSSKQISEVPEFEAALMGGAARHTLCEKLIDNASPKTSMRWYLK